MNVDGKNGMVKIEPEPGKVFVGIYDDLKPGYPLYWVIDEFSPKIALCGKIYARIFTLGLYPYVTTVNKEGDKEFVGVTVLEVDIDCYKTISDIMGVHFKPVVCTVFGVNSYCSADVFMLEGYIGGDRIKSGEWIREKK